jgi:transposase
MTEALKSDPNTLPNEVKPLQKVVGTLLQEIDFLKDRIAWFERQVFGKKSERIIEPESNDIQYLEGLEPTGDFNLSPEGKPRSPKKRKKRKDQNDNSNGLVIPENLPVEETFIDLPEKEKVCPETGEALVKIGEEVKIQLGYRSAQYFIKKTIRPKYAFPSREEEGVFTAELPDSILPRSKADESLLAEIITRKFADHLPLYRLSEIYSRDNIQITRQLLSQWMIRIGTTLKPLYDLMLKQIKDSENVYIDETPLKLQVKGKGKLQQAYMWTLVGGKKGDPPNRVYWFAENRKQDNAFDLLKGFKGVFHSDKYEAYVNISKQPEIIWQPCWAHVRRKFEEAQSGDLEFRKMILRKIRYLYMFERIAWSRCEKERLLIRKEKEAPIIDEMISAVKERVENGQLLPKSNFSKALNYFYGLIPNLKSYLSHPYARMDNNVAERAFRPLVIGRKNWLFVGSSEGGWSTAVLLSLVQTCRALGVNPREYLEDVMQRFYAHPANRLSELLPEEWAASKLQKPVKTLPLHLVR